MSLQLQPLALLPFGGYGKLAKLKPMEVAKMVHDVTDWKLDKSLIHSPTHSERFKIVTFDFPRRGDYILRNQLNHLLVFRKKTEGADFKEFILLKITED